MYDPEFLLENLKENNLNLGNWFNELFINGKRDAIQCLLQDLRKNKLEIAVENYKKEREELLKVSYKQIPLVEASMAVSSLSETVKSDEMKLDN
jgi:hypothetical protein